MNSRFHRIILTALFACIAADAYAEGLDVRQFYPIAGSEGVFSVESSRTMKHLDYDIKLLGDYANTPLKYSSPTGWCMAKNHIVEKPNRQWNTYTAIIVQKGREPKKGIYIPYRQKIRR